MLLIMFGIVWYNYYIARHLYEPREVLVEHLLPNNEANNVNPDELNENTLDDCSICLQNLKQKKEFENQYMNVVVTPCKHYFHRDCLQIWIRSHNDCPICRRECR